MFLRLLEKLKAFIFKLINIESKPIESAPEEKKESISIISCDVDEIIFK
jgi:hypothetical protein